MTAKTNIVFLKCLHHSCQPLTNSAACPAHGVFSVAWIRHNCCCSILVKKNWWQQRLFETFHFWVCEKTRKKVNKKDHVKKSQLTTQYFDYYMYKTFVVERVDFYISKTFVVKRVDFKMQLLKKSTHVATKC